jgi:tetratricopeptide (TPR) repeat protein
LDKLAKFQELKERFPQSEMPRWSIATFYEEAERYAEAITEFQDLVTIKPDYCVAFLHLGSCLIEEERFEDAIESLEKAHALAVAQSHDAPRMEAEMLLETAREELEDL